MFSPPTPTAADGWQASSFCWVSCSCSDTAAVGKLVGHRPSYMGSQLEGPQHRGLDFGGVRPNGRTHNYFSPPANVNDFPLRRNLADKVRPQNSWSKLGEWWLLACLACQCPMGREWCLFAWNGHMSRDLAGDASHNGGSASVGGFLTVLVGVGFKQITRDILGNFLTTTFVSSPAAGSSQVTGCGQAGPGRECSITSTPVK